MGCSTLWYINNYQNICKLSFNFFRFNSICLIVSADFNYHWEDWASILQMLEKLLHSSVNNVTCFRCIMHMKKMLHLFPFLSYCFNPEDAFDIIFNKCKYLNKKFCLHWNFTWKYSPGINTIKEHFILHFLWVISQFVFHIHFYTF